MAFLLQKHNVAVIYGDAYPPEFIQDSRSTSTENTLVQSSSYAFCTHYRCDFHAIFRARTCSARRLHRDALLLCTFYSPLRACSLYNMDRLDLPCKINKISKRLRLGVASSGLREVATFDYFYLIKR